ncbi:MAG: TIGR02646 family protein [Polyangiaceae bacterium]|nr:TIGR02646 family protein [Polyangiaceae bacterium]
MECTYDEMRRDRPALEAVEDGLFQEQGGLCAYTGLQIRLETGAPRKVDFHLEHVIPQEHCTYGQDADYNNLVACWPRPNCGFEPSFGARKKGSWPSPTEQHLFVSPLDSSCAARFAFNRRGEISPAHESDEAANETIKKLGLGDKQLTELRRKAIQGALEPPSGKIKLKDARRLLRGIEEDSARLDRGETIRLRAFSFVIRQALAREIKKLEGIMEKK